MRQGIKAMPPRGRHGRRIKTRPRFWTLVFLLALALAIFAGVMLVSGLHPYSAAQEEYDALREQYAPEAPPVATGPAAINPDYVGWLHAVGADIDYPVALGADNEKYLTTRKRCRGLGGERRPGNPYAALATSKSLSELERLRLTVAQQEAEIARLKNGYQVRGGGVNKEYVTLSGVSIKPSKQ